MQRIQKEKKLFLKLQKLRKRQTRLFTEITWGNEENKSSKCTYTKDAIYLQCLATVAEKHFVKLGLK